MKPFQPQWPKPPYSPRIEPHFLFIITLPYSGSTALAAVLNSSHRTTLLHERGEGQWLIPGLCTHDRWNPHKEVDYQSVKAVWLNKFQHIQQLVQTVDVVIEKSPPNMVRIEKLIGLFERSTLLANNRDPYASCVSRLYRMQDVEGLNPEKRAETLAEFAGDWVVRSHMVRGLIKQRGIPLVTYEAFCDAPATTLARLRLPDGLVDSVNPDAVIQVKDYRLQKISNQNQRQIALLTPAQIEAISECLQQHEDLLDFFGYRLRHSVGESNSVT
jgi:sulfotransferase family protein